MRASPTHNVSSESFGRSFPILVPPLRRRIPDIPALVEHFIERKSRELKFSTTPILASRAIDTLMAYDWPGNVRKLGNVIERAMILHRGKLLRFDGLGSSLARKTGVASCATSGKPLEFDVLVRQHIQHVLGLTGGKIHGPGGAGEVLGVPIRCAIR